MSNALAFIIFAVVLLVLIPIVPKMMVLRVKVLRFLHLERFANWHERHIIGLILAVRIILSVLALVMLYLGIFQY